MLSVLVFALISINWLINCLTPWFWTWRYMETSWCHWGWWGSILQRCKSFFTVYLQMNRLSNGLKWLQKMVKLWSFLASVVMLKGNASAISVIWFQRLKSSNSFMQSLTTFQVKRIYLKSYIFLQFSFLLLDRYLNT